MRAGCPRGSRVRMGVPHVLPFLHEPLRGADARMVARLPALESPSPGPEQSFFVSLVLFLYSHCAQTHWLYQRPERH